jgi:membrane protease YdiL (CAAX protease family)
MTAPGAACCRNLGTIRMSEVKRVGLWGRLPVILRAIVAGILIGLPAANVWPILLLKLGMPLAAGAEILFFIAYIWWVSGGGPPKSLQGRARDSFRAGALSGTQWIWGSIAAVFFAGTIHAAIVVLFRLVPFPAAEFHAGYDFSFIPGAPMRWLAIVISAASAGICEETGFRGYMQRPIEKRHGALVAILISSLLFMLLHLNKHWSTAGMTPIVFGAGLLLGALAWASGSLVFCIAGHTIMDIGLFAYWWTQIAGVFTQRPISETGMDQTFYIECAVFAIALLVTLVAIARLKRLPGIE